MEDLRQAKNQVSVNELHADVYKWVGSMVELSPGLINFVRHDRLMPSGSHNCKCQHESRSSCQSGIKSGLIPDYHGLVPFVVGQTGFFFCWVFIMLI